MAVHGPSRMGVVRPDRDDRRQGRRCALYAPPGMVPRAQAFPTAPVSADAILLTSMRTEPHADEPDVGADLIRGVVADLVRRNVRAIEPSGSDVPPT